MANFDDILRELHDSAILTDTEAETPIVVDIKRNFKIPEEYNTIIAHEGDVNSQVITFRLPLTHEGHDLSKCTYKRLKWKNNKSLIEGTSNLVVDRINESNLTFDITWEIPPEAFTAAGVLGFSISFYDVSEGKIAFSWNTPTCTAFSVGAAFTEIGEDGVSGIYVPAANEILFINDESRQIVMPVGYNNIFCNYGDKGTSTVYFRVKRKIKGIDLTSTDTIIEINVGFDGVVTKYSTAQLEPCLLVETKTISPDTGLVDLIWNVPAEITFNSNEYTGNITISFVFTENGKKWVSQKFDKLSIGESFIVTEDNPLEPATDWIQSQIDKYMDSQEFIIEKE